MTPNKRFDTGPQQQRFAPLLRAGQSQRSAASGAQWLVARPGARFPAFW
jgi:hypothetical protein